MPAENFGRTFNEWRDGHKQCINSKGKAFKGRKCADKVNDEYHYMQADMFNLYPAIGAVNAIRSNYNFTMLPTIKSDFGSCSMKIDNRKAEPPESARGQISRTYLYMNYTYKRYSMSKSQQQLMNSWDKMYPVETWECARAKKLLAYKKMKTMYLKGDVNLLAFGRMYIFIFLFNRIEYYPYISVDKRKTAIISSRYNSINYSLMKL